MDRFIIYLIMFLAIIQSIACNIAFEEIDELYKDIDKIKEILNKKED